MSAPGADGRERAGWRPIFVASAAYFAFFGGLGSLFSLGYRSPLSAVAFNVITTLISVAGNLVISALLDRSPRRGARDAWLFAITLSAVAAAVTEPLCWLVAIGPVGWAPHHPHAFMLESGCENFLTYLAWTLLHLFIRSGQRALAQERRIAGVREALLAAESEALTYALDPAFLLDSLGRIDREARQGSTEFAAGLVIAMAEQTRASLSQRAAGAGPPSAATALQDEIEPANPAVARKLHRRFLAWATIVWAVLLGVVAVLAFMRPDPSGYLVRFAPQPVLGALWCLMMDRVLSRPQPRPLRRLYLEAAGLCTGGALASYAALAGTTYLLGGAGARTYFGYVAGSVFYYFVPALLAWTAAWFVIDAHRRELVRLRSAAEIRQAALKARNAMLRQQVSPHFLFNAMNALHTLILDRQPERAHAVIEAVRRFLRRAGDPAQGDLVALETELLTQDAYLEIERVRFGARLNVARHVGEGLHLAKVPHLILQPLVENAVKYGVSRTDRPVTVEISAERVGEELVLKVSDTGAEGPAPAPPGLGMGLRNVEARLRSLYGDAGRLVCGPLSPQGFLAEVRIPLAL